MVSYTKITFEGLNLNKTLNYIANRYSVLNITRKGRNCQITVKSKDASKVVAFLQDKCYNICEVKKIGKAFALSFFKKHFLLPLFLLLAVIVLALSSQICWKIEVVGDFSQQEVEEALSQCDVRVGSVFHGFDADILENSLANKLDAMYAVVNRKGSTLFVNVVAKKEIDSPIDMHSRHDIVATCSGCVKSILCEQGTVAVNVGDKVKKGDTLIFGLRTFNDGTTQSVYALGCVVLELQSSAFVPFSGTKMQTVQTGNSFTTNKVWLFGKDYGANPPFENFVTQSNKTQLFPLNIVVEKVTFYETQQVVTSATVWECLDELKQQAYQLAEQNADFAVTYTTYAATEAGVTVTLFGEVQIN